MGEQHLMNKKHMLCVKKYAADTNINTHHEVWKCMKTGLISEDGTVQAPRAPTMNILGPIPSTQKHSTGGSTTMIIDAVSGQQRRPRLATPVPSSPR